MIKDDPEFFLKKFKKGIDKPADVCYNKGTERERKIPNTRKASTMKTIEVIREIVSNLSDEEFELINQAENDYWELDTRVSRNGYKRLVYHLTKAGLTVKEWWAWVDD